MTASSLPLSLRRAVRPLLLAGLIALAGTASAQ